MSEVEAVKSGIRRGNTTYIHSLRVERLVPGRIQPTHSCGKVCSITILGGDFSRVLGNTVIDPVDCFNKFLNSSLSVRAKDVAKETRTYLV